MINDITEFQSLTPETVLDAVETTLSVRCTNICRPMNSYINRVYDVECEDGDHVIIKFYRPGRWSEKALLDEHDFLFDLADAEIPVIAPFTDDHDQSLFFRDGMIYALFPKKGGRICDEPTLDQWQELGRLIARTHLTGQEQAATHRVNWTPHAATREHLADIIDAHCIAPEYEKQYVQIVEETIELISPLFSDQKLIRIHGDLHHQNLIYRPGESFYLIDFDDMSNGPPVQDIWMLLPGRLRDCVQEMDAFLDGYERFSTFDRSSLLLIEPLRAMRFVHFTAWCARQAKEGGAQRLSPDWGTPTFWRQEIQELQKQQQEIRDELSAAPLF